MRNWIVRHLNTALRRSAIASHPRDLTIGVEHEFFALAADGLPARHVDSQALIQRFGTRQAVAWDPSVGSYFDRGFLPLGGERFAVLKYDHHPHLLELNAMGVKLADSCR